MSPNAAPLVLAALLQGCVMVPRTVEGYDAECRTQARHMVLDAVQVASIGSCSNQGCGVAVAVAGVTAAASVVVSGTIAVAGNVVYWLEKQGRCER
ncbi:MAG: hypothetical protein K0S48_1022 [Ramlibacter sp.]|nr:hypothetical protein [Ramlibacter sp.]